jgi:thiol-disulfide isomerase/thioredoxin
MLRSFSLLCFLVASLSATAQRSRVTKATVFTDVDGSVLSREAYRNKLKTKQFTAANVQISNSIITSISLRPAPAPDSVRTQAISPVRTYLTPAPAFTLTDINGRTYSLAELRSKVVVLNFWFIGCAPCQREMPALKQLTVDYRANPNVVFISFAREDADRLRRYVAKKGDFGFAVVPLPQKLAQEFGITGYPTTAVIDQSGRYAYDNEGYAGNFRRLRQTIERVLR